MGLLMLMPTTMVPTDWDTVTMVWATEPTDTDTPMPIITTARGPLMPSPPRLPSPRLMPMPTTATTVTPGPMDTDTDTVDTEATTGDKFSASEVQSKAQSEHHSLLSDLISFSAPL